MFLSLIRDGLNRKCFQKFAKNVTIIRTIWRINNNMESQSLLLSLNGQIPAISMNVLWWQAHSRPSIRCLHWTINLLNCWGLLKCNDIHSVNTYQSVKHTKQTENSIDFECVIILHGISYLALFLSPSNKQSQFELNWQWWSSVGECKVREGGKVKDKWLFAKLLPPELGL